MRLIIMVPPTIQFIVTTDVRKRKFSRQLRDQTFTPFSGFCPPCESTISQLAKSHDYEVEISYNITAEMRRRDFWRGPLTPIQAFKIRELDWLIFENAEKKMSTAIKQTHVFLFPKGQFLSQLLKP